MDLLQPQIETSVTEKDGTIEIPVSYTHLTLPTT